MGHYVVAKKLGYTLSRFSISPFGFELAYFEQRINYDDEIKIAFAGPFMNIASSFLICGLWWITPTTYFWTESFVAISMVLALTNLLPAYPLDGGRIFVGVCNHVMKEKTAVKITMIVNIILSSLCCVAFVFCLFYNFNPTLLALGIFLFSGMLKLKGKSQFDKINIFSKHTKNFVKPNFLYVDASATIGQMLAKLQPSKTTVFCVCFDDGRVVYISEKMLLKLSINYGIEKKLKIIFSK